MKESNVNRKNTVEIEKLKTQIKLHDRILKNKEDAQTYYRKAEVLKKISILEKDDGGDSNNNESTIMLALKCIDRAISINESNALYYISRSQINIEIGDTDRAINDLRQIQGMEAPSDELSRAYLDNTMKDIAKLDAVKDGINNLVAEGKIDSGLARFLNEHVNVTAGLVVKIETHDDRLDTLESTLERLTSAITELQTGKITIEEAFGRLQIQTDTNTARIEVIEEQMLQFVSRDEFDSYAVIAEDRISMYEDKIQMIEVDVEGQRKTIVHIDDSLRKANIFAEAEVKQELDSLRDQGEAVYEYASKFYWILSNYLLAYRVLSTGMVEGKAFTKASDIVSKASSGVSAAKGAFSVLKKLGEYSGVILKVVGEVSKAAPIIGNAVGVVTDVAKAASKAYDKAKSDQIIKKVNDSVLGNITDKDLSLAIAKAGVEIAKQKADILNSTAVEKAKGFGKVKEKATQAQEWMSSKVDNVLTKITGVKGVDDSKVAKLALTDVVLLITMITTKDGKLVEGEGAIELGHKIADMFKPQGLIDEQLTEMCTEANGKHIEVKTAIIEYDNILLHHPELLKGVSDKLGISFSKAVDYSKDLDIDLAREAVFAKDVELLADMMVSME